MMSKLISILFALNIVMCSIGVQVLQHNCIWCGGDRMEFIIHSNTDEADAACCSEQDPSHHDCREEGCCEPKLLKLTTGMASEIGFDLKRTDLKPVIFEAIYVTSDIESACFNFIENDFWDKNCFPSFSPPPSFLSPLRC